MKPTQLALCRACHQFVKPTEIDCPHCGADILRAALLYQERLEEANAAAERLQALLRELGLTPPAG